MTKGERTRERIVARAAEVFNRRGYAAASMAELTEATEIQKGGLYRHFESKEQLALAAFRHAMGVARQARFSLAADAAQQTALARLLEFVHLWVRPHSPLVPGGCPLLNATVAAGDGGEWLLDAVREELHSWTQRLAAVVQGGLDRREFAGVNPLQVSRFLIASLEGGLVLSRIEKSAEPLQGVADTLKSWLQRELSAPA